MTTGLGGGALVAAIAVASLLVGAGAGALVALRAKRRREGRFHDAQAALRASEDRLRWALDAATDIVWDWDVVSDTIYHPSWAQTYGFPEERTPRTGKELAAFIHPEDMPRFHAEMSEAAAGPKATFEVEHRALTGSGDWRWMVGRGRVVARDGAGHATRIVGACTDITERKRMVGRLQIADRMASIGTLAAGIAHEINNPLAYVIGNVDFALERLRALLDAGPQADRTVRECAEALSEARVGAQRMRDIVRDVKIFSRAEEDVRAPVAIGRVLRGALSLAGSEIRHRARVAVEVAEMPPVLASESRLSQLFLNLLVNAAQAIPEGHADQNLIRVTVGRGAGGEVVVEVSDTGCGIPPAHLKRLFDPFFTTKAAGIGTGLGLPICHGIVTDLGGEIDVASEPGKGSTFRVTLPASVTAPAPPLPSPPPPAAGRSAPARRGRVLVVDDEPLFCRMAERALGLDHDVVVAQAPDALRRLRAGERYDVVVTDLVMPVLTGMELYEEIARVDPTLAARTLFATGGAFTPGAAEFVARRPDRVLEKPVSAEALRAAVAEALERAPVDAARVA